MPVIIPELSDPQLSALPSSAERKVYEAFRDRLSSRYVVLFESKWAAHGPFVCAVLR
jgi:hypothetical protein